MNLFKGKIKCISCGRNYNFKNDNGIPIYVCSGYKNYGAKCCPRNIVHEKDLVNLVKLHLNIIDKTCVLSKEIIQEKIDRIEIDGDNICIYYYDGTKSEWNKSKLSI